MKKLFVVTMGVVVALAMVPPAWAHVTLNPPEASPGSFSRFAVRVPNERPDENTTMVEVRFPETLFLVSFQDVPGWERTVTMKKLDEPVELFGTEISEVVDTVTWAGGKVEPGEFTEFGFSARIPEEPGALEFPTLQTYDSGEVVEWTGPPDAETPAATVEVLDFGAGEGEGELAVLARIQKDVAALRSGGDEGETDGSALPMALGGGGLVVASIALIVALRRSSRGGTA